MVLMGEDDSVRAGQQQIKVKIRTGEHKGEILDATSLHRICMVPDVE